MRNTVLLIIISLFTWSLHSQRVKVLDSLYSLWKDDSQKDSLRIIAYHRYIWNGYMGYNLDSVKVFSDELLKFVETKELPWALANTYFLKAEANRRLSNYQLALDLFFKSLEYRDTTAQKRQIAATLGQISVTYKQKGDFYLALKNEEKSLEISREINNKDFIGVSLYNIGVIYQAQGNYIKALDYYKSAFKIRKALGYEDRLASSYDAFATIYSNLGEHGTAIEYLRNAIKLRKNGRNKMQLAANYSNLSNEFTSLKLFDSSLLYIDKSLKLANESGSAREIAISLQGKGKIYEANSDLENAKFNYEKGLKILQDLEVKTDPALVSLLINVGQVEFMNKNYLNSEINCLTAYKMAKVIEAKNELKIACVCLYDTYKALGNSKKALQYHEEMITLNNSLKLKETAKKLQKMEFEKQVLKDSLQQVEKELKVEMAHQAEVRKKDRNRNLALAGGVFFLFLSGGLYSRWRYVKNSKTIIEKEKDRSDNLLLNILPSEIAEELKAKGSADARDFDLVSILFTDFKGFTQASEKLTAKELIDEINTCFEAFDYICEKYGIEKIKTIGDAYMAAGGLPVPSDISVKNTLMAALEMQHFIVSRLAEKEVNNELAFQMRVGVHTGPVVAGIVGVKKFQYDIWGDTVNTASRMESSGAVGKVNVSETTYNLIKDDPDFTFESRGKINAKGKGDIEMYFVSLKPSSLRT